MKIFCNPFYIPKYCKEKISDNTLTRAVFTSVVGIVVCMVCLVGLTWAWCSENVESNTNKLQAANFDFSITVTENESGTAVEGTDGLFALDTAKTYTVTLEKNSAASTGFCHISATLPGSSAASAYFTENIPYTVDNQAVAYVFTITGFESMKLTPIWGASTADSSNLVAYNSTLQPAVLPGNTSAPEPTTPATEPTTVSTTPEETQPASTESTIKQEQP